MLLLSMAASEPVRWALGKECRPLRGYPVLLISQAGPAVLPQTRLAGQ